MRHPNGKFTAETHKRPDGDIVQPTPYGAVVHGVDYYSGFCLV
jgi:hypothetical protein